MKSTHLAPGLYLISLAAFFSASLDRARSQDAVAYVEPPRPFVFEGRPNPPFVQEAPQESLPAPTPSPEDIHAAEEADIAIRMKFFEAIADNDKQTFLDMLNAGMDPNAELPSPAPEAFQKRFTDERLRYYVSSEKGFTALMLATSLGNQTFVKFLLIAGANPLKMTKRHKTYALWLAGKYKQVEIMRSLMGIDNNHESSRYLITINLAHQEAVLWRDGKIDFVTPISSGRQSHPTPVGRYLVTDKYKMWNSTLYHAKMPLFMRLSCSDFGLHVGVLPGYPASHGCIRLPESSAKKLFANVPVGTLVEIQ